MPWSCVGAQQGLGTVSGLIKWTCFRGLRVSRAAGELRGACKVRDTYQRLHDGVIGGVHVGVEGEGALSVAVVSCVTLRRDDPVLVGGATRMLAQWLKS